MLFRPAGSRGGIPQADYVMPGDLVAGGESISAGAIATVGAGTWTAAAIATGIIRRTGPVGGYTDTTDTSTNILAALAGNNGAADAVPGTSFRLRFINTVAQAMTFAAGTGVVVGTGTLDAVASIWREYLVTILNATPAFTLQSNTTNASAAVTFVLPPGAVSIPIGPNSAINPSSGMIVSGTGITAGTTILGVTSGQGGITGVTLSANATATSAAGGVPLTFLPAVRFDTVGSGTL